MDFVPIIQRIMTEEISQSLLKTVARRIQDYRNELLECGYSFNEITVHLTHLFLPSFQGSVINSKEPHQEILMHIIKNSLQFYPTINQALTALLLSLEIEIVRVTHQQEEQETSRPEQKEAYKDISELLKAKPKKKKENMRKKKGKNCKMTGLEEIKARTLVAMELEKEEISNNLKKIQLLKSYFERRVLMELCQQTALNFNPFQVQA